MALGHISRLRCSIRLVHTQQQCPCNIVECYKFNDSFDNVECCFDIVAVFGNNVAGFGNNVAGFDIVSKTATLLPKNGNNVEATFDIVERT